MNLEHILILLVLVALGYFFRKTKGSEDYFAACKRKYGLGQSNKLNALETIEIINKNSKYVFSYKDHFYFKSLNCPLTVFLGSFTGDFSGYLLTPAASKSEGIYIASENTKSIETLRKSKDTFNELLSYEKFSVFVIKNFDRFSSFLEFKRSES